MSDHLQFTGERFTPECEREIWYEHMHRYAFALGFCRGKQVLDAACGEGYGAALLAGGAARVTGVDLEAPVIEHARQRYAGRENLEFVEGDCGALPFGDAQFDRVVSFETLEHLEAQEAMLEEFRRVLKPDGLLIISTPDKAEYSDRLGFDNEFHVRELYREEFEALLASRFPAVRLLGQSLAFYSVICDRHELSSASVQTLHDDGSLQQGRRSQAPVYLLALCAAQENLLPPTAGKLWLFDDAQSAVVAHYHHEIRKNMQAGGILASKQAEIQALQSQLDSISQPWWRRWFTRA